MLIYRITIQYIKQDKKLSVSNNKNQKNERNYLFSNDYKNQVNLKKFSIKKKNS